MLLLRSEGLELPERHDWEDPRFPTADAAITRLDDQGQPAEELLMVTDYPVWFEPEGEDPGSEPLLQGQLWMQSDDLPVSPEALDGARVLLELELSTAEREPARASLELVLDLESRDS